MSEILDIFNENFEKIGQEDREVVHKLGYWHQTFHCWILTHHDGKNYVLVQRRSAQKSNAPNLLDISAAGHLLAGESAEDGVREVQEELGINPQRSKMTNLGIRISASGVPGKKCNREFCHVVLLEDNTPLIDHTLQEEEVSALVEIELNEGLHLLSGECDSILCKALVVEHGRKKVVTTNIRYSDFIPRLDPYYLKIFIMAERYFEGKKYLAI
ncbi:MAG: NUDIX domain-containing protein [Clostridiales bacterium]|nr:NUDIX domain-containing protein [Clostridiales bacterium]